MAFEVKVLYLRFEKLLRRFEQSFNTQHVADVTVGLFFRYDLCAGLFFLMRRVLNFGSVYF